MANINEPIRDPFNPDVEHDSYSAKWFTGKALQAIALTGIGITAYKMRGPTGKLVQKYLDRQMNSRLAKDMLKAQDAQDYLLGSDFSVRPPNFGIPEIDYDILSPELADDGFPSTASATNSLNSIENLEDSIVRQTTEEIAFSTGALPRIGPGPVQPKIDLSDINIEKNDIFWEARSEALFDFLQKNTSMESDDWKDLAKLRQRGTAKDKAMLAEKHRAYAQMYPEYADRYARTLKKLRKNFETNRSQHLAIDANIGKRLQENQVVKMFNDPANLSNDATFPFDEMINAKRVIPSKVDIKDILSKGGTITSGSLDKTVNLDPKSLYAKLGQFDYFPLLKKLSERLENIKTHEAGSINLEDLNYEVIAKGRSIRPDYHLRITFKFNGVSRPLNVEVPLSQWGRIPGVTEGVSHRTDRLYELPNGVRNVYKKFSGNINTDFENTTQQALRKLVTALDSRIIDQARTDPLKAIHQLQGAVNNIIRQAPVAENLTSDAIKALIIQPSFYKKNTTDMSLMMLNDAVATGYNIKRFSSALADRKNAINITLDFEAIAPDVGPQHMARSEDTQLTKAGIVVHEISYGKVRPKAAHEIVSDHGIDIVRKLGVSEDTADWVSRELPRGKLSEAEFCEYVATLRKQGPEAVFDEWARKAMEPAARSYQTLRGGRKFKNNIDFAEHVGKQILDEMDEAKRSGKEIFITTKNGNMFDLHLLKRYAPNSWAQIEKHHRNLIDLQSIAYFRQQGFGGTDSLSLNKILMQTMRRIDPSVQAIDIDKKGNLRKAIEWFNRQKGYQITSTTQLDYLEKMGINLQEAHSTPAGDAMAEFVMLMDEAHKVRSGDRVYHELDELQRWLTKQKKILGLDETLQEYRALETRYTVFGRVASAALLSQGNIQNELVSLFTPDQLFPFPDNKLSKQWYQLEKGHANRLNRNWFRNRYKTDIERTKAIREAQVPSIITQGELHTKDYLRLVGDDTAAMSHKVFADTLAVWNPYRGKEGFQSWSSDVWKQREFIFDKVVPLNPNSYVNDSKIRKDVTDLIQDANALARERMGTLEGDIPADVMEKATQDALAKRKPIVVGPGETVLAKGERGYETIKTEFGGTIYHVFSAKDAGGKVRTYAKIRFVASGSDMESVATRARSFLSKGIAVTDKLLSLGTAMGGPQAVVNADFFEKGYVGAMKTFIASEINDRFNRVIMDPNSPQDEIVKAKNAQKRFLTTMNGELTSEGTLVTTPRDITDKLRYIKDPELKAKAQLFVGGIDLNSETMLGHMRDAGMNWNIDEAKRYYQMFGGEKRVIEHVMGTINNARKSIDDMIDLKGGVLQGVGMDTRNRLKNDTAVMLRSFLLPDLKKLQQKDYKQATIFGFHKEFAGIKDSPMQFGVRGRVGSAIYGLMRGMQADVKDVKLRGDLLKMIDIPGTTVGRDTLRIIKENRQYANERRFLRAAQTVQNFKNALLSSAMTSGSDLSLDDLNTLVDRIGGIDLESLKRTVLSGEDLTTLESKAVTFLEEAKDSGDLEDLVHNIVKDIEINDTVKTFKKNKGFVTGAAVSKIVDLAKKKGGVFAYSAKKELGGAFTFNIKDIINHGLNITDQPDTIDRTMEFFTRLSKRPDSIVESIDPTNYTVKLKKLIFHADMSGQNIFNALNPAGKEGVVGLLTNAARKRQDALIALQKFEQQFERVKTTGEMQIDESFISSQAIAKKQYVRYLLDGFLLDSESVYKRAFDMAPTGIYSTIAGAEGVFSRAVHLQRIGIKNFDKQIDQGLENKINKVVKNVVEDSVINDVFVTRSFFEKMRVKEGNNFITVQDKLKLIFGSQTKADEVFESIARGELKVPSFGVGFPTYQNATDAALGLTLKVVPDEVAPYLGMNSNVMNVFAEMARIQARDFDGDQIALVLKDLNKSQDLMQWQADHRGALAKIMQRADIQTQMVADDKGIKRLGFGIDSFLEGGNVMMMGTDERGKIVHEILPSHNVPLGDVTAKMVDLATQTSIHTSSNLTSRYVSDQMDMVAQVAVSKQNIGLFTNVYRKRISQILQAGIVKDPLDKALLIGNSTIGLGKLSQDIISLAKHGTGVDEIAKVAKVFISDSSSSFDRERVFGDYFMRTFDSIDLPMDKRRTLLQQFKDSIKKVKYEEGVEGIHAELKSLRSIDSGSALANIFDVVLSEENLNTLRYTSEFAQEAPTALGRMMGSIKKKVKFEPEIHGQVFRKAGKWGAVGAAAFLALNFFRPSQLSNSANPLDAFTDLGVDFNGDYNILGTPPELQRGIPLDRVDASFSRQAFIKLHSANSGRNKEDRGQLIRNMLRDSFSGYDSFIMDHREPQTTRYSNYTQNIGSFGNNTLYRRSKLL